MEHGALQERSPAERPVPMSGPVPGIGLAGTTMCPFMSVVHPAPCLKGGCELWVELNYGTQRVGRCSLAWVSVLSTEVRGAIEHMSRHVAEMHPAQPIEPAPPEDVSHGR